MTRPIQPTPREACTTAVLITWALIILTGLTLGAVGALLITRRRTRA